MSYQSTSPSAETRLSTARAQPRRREMLVGLTDVSGRIYYLNPAGRALLGLKESEAASATNIFECRTAKGQRQMREEAVPLALQKGVWTGTSELVRRDGRHIETNSLILIHCDDDGAPDGLLVIEHRVSKQQIGERGLVPSRLDSLDTYSWLLAAQETERQKIASNLHDSIGPLLILLKLQIAKVTSQLASSGAFSDVQELVHGMAPKVQEILDQLRRVETDLCPSTLKDLGLLATVSWLCRELEQASCSVRVEKDLTVQECDVPPDLKFTIFRILQEAACNIIKHAEARRILVSLKLEGGALRLSVQDDGKGFDPSTLQGHCARGLGLRSMQERARLSGGSFNLISDGRLGTHIQVTWPVRSLGFAARRKPTACADEES